MVYLKFLNSHSPFLVGSYVFFYYKPNQHRQKDKTMNTGKKWVTQSKCGIILVRRNNYWTTG